MKAFVLHVCMRHSHLPGGGLASKTLIHMQKTSLPFHNQEKENNLLLVSCSFKLVQSRQSCNFVLMRLLSMRQRHTIIKTVLVQKQSLEEFIIVLKLTHADPYCKDHRPLLLQTITLFFHSFEVSF